MASSLILDPMYEVTTYCKIPVRIPRLLIVKDWGLGIFKNANNHTVMTIYVYDGYDKE